MLLLLYKRNHAGQLLSGILAGLDLHCCGDCTLIVLYISTAIKLDLNRHLTNNLNICVLYVSITYGILTKREVKMAGYWPSSLFVCLWTEMKSRSINSQIKNKANIQPS